MQKPTGLDFPKFIPGSHANTLKTIIKMQWKNAVTDVFGIEYPIVQAPMLGVTTPEMVAEISNGGALGSLPVGGLPPDKTGERRVR